MRRLLPSAILNITRRLRKESVFRPLDVPVQELVLGLCPTYGYPVLRHLTRPFDTVRVHCTCASLARRPRSFETHSFVFRFTHARCVRDTVLGQTPHRHLLGSFLLPLPPTQSKVADINICATERRFTMPCRDTGTQARSTAGITATTPTLFGLGDASPKRVSGRTYHGV